jgi:hypothetical protein
MAGEWPLGKPGGLLVVDHGPLVELVLPAEHTLGLVRIELADPSRRGARSWLNQT